MAPIFTPVNTSSKFYIYSGGKYSISDVIDAVKEYFGPSINMDDVTITGEYIHARCLTYDRYDPTDYDTYLVVELTNVTEE